MSIVYEPRNGAVYKKVASGALLPPEPHDAPPIRLEEPTVLPLTATGRTLPRSEPGQASVGVEVGDGVDVEVGGRVAVAVGVRVNVSVGELVGVSVGSGVAVQVAVGVLGGV